MTGRCLLFVHAHPDDECLSTGGTIARYADSGVRVVLVTCTNGEAGEIADVPDLGTIDEIRGRLGAIRVEELKEACRRLGEVDLRLLGYHDSGMDGTPENDSPGAFVNQDIDEAAGRVAAIISETKPAALVTYNEMGFYGHPDHIRAHDVAMRAVKTAAPVHTVPKVYFTAVPKSLLIGGRDLAEQFDRSADDFFSLEEIERIGTDDNAITTSIDVSDYVDRKFHALEAHRTQLGTTGRFLQIPEDVRAVAMGTEHYVLTGPSGTQRETDLFEGL
jgi:N-acetyl-1-D-myo-inositol-2-amino-2-deoxy-alpha-D-glucopyranoside deacetylase